MRPMIGVLARNWWMLVVRGVAAVLFGLTAWVWPDLTVSVLVALFGAYALVSGVFAVGAGIASYGEDRRWWAEVLTGVAGIVLGVLVFVWPDVTARALLYLIAAWAISTGVFEIAAAIELRREIEGEWLLILAGVAAVLFGALLAIFPGDGAIALIWLIGAQAIVVGGLLIGLGFRLRGMWAEMRGDAASRPGSP